MPDNGDLGSVKIGAREIYDLTLATKDLVERVGDKVGSLADDIKDLRAADDKLDLRVRELEERRWPLPVIGTVASLVIALVAVLGFVVSLLIKHG